VRKSFNRDVVHVEIEVDPAVCTHGPDCLTANRLAEVALEKIPAAACQFRKPLMRFVREVVAPSLGGDVPMPPPSLRVVP
jgi:hypothetical protein